MNSPRLRAVVSAMFFACTFSFATVAHAADAPVKAADTGDYRDAFFGVTFPIPSEWQVKSRSEQHKQLQAAGEEMVREGVVSAKQAAADDANTQKLLQLEKTGTGRITMIAEKIHDDAPFKDAAGYLAHTMKLISKSSSLLMTVVDPIADTQLGGANCSSVVFKVEKDIGSATWIHYYTTTIKGYAFSVIAFAPDKEQLAEVERVAHTIVFDPQK